MKKVLRDVLSALFLLFCWPLFLYKVYGNKDYKLTGRTIIISNHYSTFDAFFIYLIYGRKRAIHFVTIEETKKKLWSRFITWLFDCVYINKATINISFFKKCIRILNDDGVICIFPEGYVNPRKYGFLLFKASYIFFARKTQAIILPLYIYPRISFLKKTLIYVGDPLWTEDYAQFADRDEASIYVQSQIMNYSERIDQVLEQQKHSRTHHLE